MDNRCILAQDLALYWADSEIIFLRWSPTTGEREARLGEST
jgi:hypothetical protein